MAKITALRVVSKKASFRRAGFCFSAEPIDIPVTGLSKAQRTAIEDDSSLVSYEVEVEAEVDAADEADTEDSASKSTSKAKK